MKKLRTNKKFVLVASLVLTAVMILAATFAWFSQKDRVENDFKTGGIAKDSVTIWEDFEKPEEWKPGQEVNKDVGVINKGNMPVFVRATYTEVLNKLVADDAIANELKLEKSATMKTGDDLKGFKEVPTVDYSAADSGWTEVSGTSEYKMKETKTDVKFYYQKATVNNKEVVHVGATSTNKGYVSAKFSVKDKEITATNVEFNYYIQPATPETKEWAKAAFPTEFTKSAVDEKIKLAYHAGNVTDTPTKDKWFYNKEDGWFYYVGVVKGGTITPLFLDSVTLDKDAGNDYQFMDYKLVVDAHGIQATMDAVKAEWGITETNPIYAVLADALK